MTKLHRIPPILMKFGEDWRNLLISQLFRPEREKLHFHCPVCLARFEIYHSLRISMSRQEFHVIFMKILWILQNFFNHHSFSLQGENVALANGIYYVLGVRNAKNQDYAHFH